MSKEFGNRYFEQGRGRRKGPKPGRAMHDPHREGPGKMNRFYIRRTMRRISRDGR